MEVPFEILKGKTIRKVLFTSHHVDWGLTEQQGDMIIFEISDEEQYRMLHHHDCCEEVHIEDICGEIEWIIGEPILRAEKRSNKDNPKSHDDYRDFSCTWTFYELSTIKGSVTIRWYGSSNGYYSEEVDFERIPKLETEIKQ